MWVFIVADIIFCFLSFLCMLVFDVVFISHNIGFWLIFGFSLTYTSSVKHFAFQRYQSVHSSLSSSALNFTVDDRIVKIVIFYFRCVISLWLLRKSRSLKNTLCFKLHFLPWFRFFLTKVNLLCFGQIQTSWVRSTAMEWCISSSVKQRWRTSTVERLVMDAYKIAVFYFKFVSWVDEIAGVDISGGNRGGGQWRSWLKELSWAAA